MCRSATFLGYALIGIPILAAAACYAEFSNVCSVMMYLCVTVRDVCNTRCPVV